MIKVFKPTDRDYTSNGDIVLKPYKALIRKEDFTFESKGNYYIDIETGLEYVYYRVEGNIVVASTPQGEQAFRISNPNKTKNKISVRAWSMFYDSEKFIAPDLNVTDETCAEVLDLLNDLSFPHNQFTVSSDVEGASSFTCTKAQLYDAICMVIDTYGGHLVRDNFDLQVKADISHDNGVTVEYRKNLKDITCEENWDDVVTCLLPIGKDGILLNHLDQEASIYVTNGVSYDVPYNKIVQFDQSEINEEDYGGHILYIQALLDDLYAKAMWYINLNCVPKVNYTLSAHLDRITDIGEIIRVKDDRLGVDLLTNVIAFTYDCISERYTEVEFGNFMPALPDLVEVITNKVLKKLKG